MLALQGRALIRQICYYPSCLFIRDCMALWEGSAASASAAAHIINSYSSQLCLVTHG